MAYLHLLSSRLYCRFRNRTGSKMALPSVADSTAGREFHPAMKTGRLAAPFRAAWTVNSVYHKNGSLKRAYALNVTTSSSGGSQGSTAVT